MSESIHRQLGDDWTSQLGFRWLWNERLDCYVCVTPGCGAREADRHSAECCAAAKGGSVVIEVGCYEDKDVPVVIGRFKEIIEADVNFVRWLTPPEAVTVVNGVPVVGPKRILAFPVYKAAA